MKMMQPEKCSTLGTKTTTDQAGKFSSLNVRQPLGFTFHLRLKFGSAIARLTFKAVVSLASNGRSSWLLETLTDGARFDDCKGREKEVIPQDGSITQFKGEERDLILEMPSELIS